MNSGVLGRIVDARRARLIISACAAATVAVTGYSLAAKHQVPLANQTVPDSQEYADAAWHLSAGDGYVTTFRDSLAHPAGENPPRYPPGYPLVLAPSGLVGNYPLNIQRGAKLIGLAYFLAVAAAAWSLGGPLAALLAAVAVWATPFAATSVQFVLSDALGALLGVAILGLVQRRARWAPFAAGALAGYGVVVRLNAVVLLIALLVTLPGRHRVRAAASAAPFLGALAIWQWTAFGAPWRTGYSYWLPGLEAFRLGYFADHVTREGPWPFPDRFGDSTPLDGVCNACGTDGPMASLANWSFYPLVAAGLLWVVTPPLVGIAGAAASWIWRREPAARLTLWTTGLTLTLHAFYFFQAARFLATAASMLTIMAAVAAARLVRRHAGPFRRFAYPEGSFRPGEPLA